MENNPQGDRRLTGRVAVVTGASRRRGIGAAICRTLAAEGADVFFTHWSGYDEEMPWGTDDEGPEALREELKELGVRCEGMHVDLSRPEAPGRVLDAARERLGPPKIVVNNAAHYSVRYGLQYEYLDAAMLDAHYAVNLRATALLSVEFARRYAGGPGGRIVSLTSGQFLGPMLGELAYVATKGAIEAFTISLSAEVASKGITVNAVGPGPTDTGNMLEELKGRLVEKFPTGRIGRPEDVARLVAFLAGDEARWITGQIIHSEGGFLRA
jgi:3-oxoacyl-[acyl-carrier protein] reductase